MDDMTLLVAQVLLGLCDREDYDNELVRDLRAFVSGAHDARSAFEEGLKGHLTSGEL